MVIEYRAVLYRLQRKENKSRDDIKSIYKLIEWHDIDLGIQEAM